MTTKRILIIGGGFGGAAAARTLAAAVGEGAEVTLIDRNTETYLCGGFPLLIIGERSVQQVRRSLPGFAKRAGVRFVQAEVERLDTGRQEVRTGAGTFGYDYLVLGPGARYDWDAVPGSAGAHSFYSIETARKLRARLRSFKGGRIVVAVAALPYKCPPAPFEAAMVLDWLLKDRGVRNSSEIHVYTPEPAPLKVAGPEATAALKAELERRGVTLHLEVAVTEVAADGRSARFSDGSSLDADIVITIPVHRAPAVAAEAGLLGESGWVKVDPRTLATGAPNVFAVGDATAVLMANGMPIPKAGVFAASQGETVARNIEAEITGGKKTEFPGEGYCFLSASGEAAGVVEGSFLAAEKPDVTFRGPSEPGMKRKEQFEADWRAFRI